MSAAISVAGCFPFPVTYTCETTYTDCTPGTGGQGGGTVPSRCEADPREDPSSVSEECAVFANSAAAPGGDGTRARPFASLQEALDKASGKRVLACADVAFPQSVTVVAEGAQLVGGFDCAQWTWSAEARSTIEGAPNQTALTLAESAQGAKVQSFTVKAASATVAGGSSIGVAVADVAAELSRVDISAGDARDGESGTTPAEPPLAGAAAPAMRVSNACVAPNAVFGGEAGVTACDDGESRGGVGGVGGVGATDSGNGQAGQDGAPAPVPNPDEYGLGGAGQRDALGNCRRGEDGAPGASGAPGAGGADTAFTLAGPTGGDGASGIRGARGQGGGGGGGAKAGLFCPAGMGLVEGVGASGGGGGAGGCGGQGGLGGKAGGSSLGLLSLGTRLVLSDVTVAVGKAGKGGDGASGQAGATGGLGATGGTGSGLAESISGCRGGDGGRGGAGGLSGGGRGGHAVGLAFATTPSPAPTLQQFTPGTAGPGGAPGPGGADSSAGVPGVAGSCWSFSAGAACAP